MALATFTFGDALITLVEFAFLFLWIWIAIGVIFDIFRSRDLSNWSKALWLLFIFVLPLFGVLGYMIVRGHALHEHHEQDAQARHQAFAQLGQRGASSGPADDLGKLGDLHERGVLTDEEFERAKAKVLAA
jgi:hypothetical protein